MVDDIDDRKVKCLICDDELDYEKDNVRWIDNKPGDYEWFADESKAGDVCADCLESIDYDGTSLVILANGGKFDLKFNQGIVTGDFPTGKRGLGGNVALIEKVVKCIRSIVGSEKWVRIDGWRGYVDITGGDACAMIEDFGVFWGHHSEDMRKNENDAINDAFETLGIPLFMAFSRTSNVFSNNASYFVPKEDKETASKIIEFIKSWFETDDWRWNTGLIFSDLQDTQPTKDVLESMRKKGRIEGVNWQEVAGITTG
jgi:hypothetical protein